MKAIVFAGAHIANYNFCSEYINNSDFFVACDSGLKHCKNLNLIPNCIVGDFDSVDLEMLSHYQKMNIETITLPTHKDETDLEIGLDIAIEKGAKEIIIIGAIGSRADHSMANLHYLLYLLKKNISAKIVNENNEIVLINKDYEITGEKGHLVSLIPLSLEVIGVTTKGLEYPLNNHTMTLDSRLIAVSNVMLEKTATISLKDGFLYVMKCRD